MQGGITPQVPVQSMYVNMDWVASFHLCVFPDVESVCVFIQLCVCAEQPCFTSRLLPVELRKPLCFLVWLLASVSALPLFLLQHIELDWKLLELLKLIFIVFSLSGTQLGHFLLTRCNLCYAVLLVRVTVEPVGYSRQYILKRVFVTWQQVVFFPQFNTKIITEITLTL